MTYERAVCVLYVQCEHRTSWSEINYDDLSTYTHTAYIQGETYAADKKIDFHINGRVHIIHTREKILRHYESPLCRI